MDVGPWASRYGGLPCPRGVRRHSGIGVANVDHMSVVGSVVARTGELMLCDGCRAYFYSPPPLSDLYMSRWWGDFKAGDEEMCGRFDVSMHGIRRAAMNCHVFYWHNLEGNHLLKGGQMHVCSTIRTRTTACSWTVAIMSGLGRLNHPCGWQRRWDELTCVGYRRWGPDVIDEKQVNVQC